MDKQVCIPRPQWDYPIIGPIESTTMWHVFIFDCSCVEQSLRILIGEEFLKNASGNIFYADIVSRFLSNCMDFIQEAKIIEKLENAYVWEYFVPPTGYHEAICAYRATPHASIAGSLFSHKAIEECEVASCIYSDVHQAITNECDLVLVHALNAQTAHLGERLVKRVTNLYNAFMSLYTNPPKETSVPCEQKHPSDKQLPIEENLTTPTTDLIAPTPTASSSWTVWLSSSTINWLLVINWKY